MRKHVAAIALAIAGTAMLAPMTAGAIGAIAVEDDTEVVDVGYGVSVGHETKIEAEADALKTCRESGNRECRIVGWFKRCGAYAASRKYYGFGFGKTKAIAKRAALDQCASDHCKIVVAECEDAD